MRNGRSERELSIDVPPETRRAIERAAAERGVSVSQFLEDAVRKHLADTGYLDEEAAKQRSAETKK